MTTTAAKKTAGGLIVGMGGAGKTLFRKEKAVADDS
jgi:hypothetical protein